MERTTTTGATVPTALAVLVVGALAVLGWQGVSTASARFAGTTSNEQSLFQAASVAVVVGEGSTAELTLDADGLYPGRVEERCFPVTFLGSTSGADVRLHAGSAGPSTLDRYLLLEVETGAGESLDCGDFVAADRVFDDTVATLQARHGDFATGLPLLVDAADGESTHVRVAMQVADDDEAQGAASAFWLTVEGRP